MIKIFNYWVSQWRKQESKELITHITTKKMIKTQCHYDLKINIPAKTRIFKEIF